MFFELVRACNILVLMEHRSYYVIVCLAVIVAIFISAPMVKKMLLNFYFLTFRISQWLPWTPPPFPVCWMTLPPTTAPTWLQTTPTRKIRTAASNRDQTRPGTSSEWELWVGVKHCCASKYISEHIMSTHQSTKLLLWSPLCLNV